MRYRKPTPEQVEAFKEWLATLPPKVKEIAEKFDVWTLYRMKSTGQRVFIQSFDETDDGVTLVVGVSGEFNLVTHERAVFGIDPDDLEECDLPRPGELVGNADLDFDTLKNVLEERKKQN